MPPAASSSEVAATATQTKAPFQFSNGRGERRRAPAAAPASARTTVIKIDPGTQNAALGMTTPGRSPPRKLPRISRLSAPLTQPARATARGFQPSWRPATKPPPRTQANSSASITGLGRSRAGRRPRYPVAHIATVVPKPTVNRLPLGALIVVHRALETARPSIIGDRAGGGHAAVDPPTRGC